MMGSRHLKWNRWTLTCWLKRSSFLGLLILGSLTAPLWAAGSSTLSLNQLNLTGRLNDFPLKGILLELSSKAGFELEIFGTLDQSVTISFRDQPLIEGIKDMMRLTGVSFVIIQSSSEALPQPETQHGIQALLVFDTGRSSSLPERGSQGMQHDQQEDDFSYELELGQEEPIESLENTLGTNGQNEVEFEGTQEDLKDFVDSLSENKTITKDEYEMIMEKIK